MQNIELVYLFFAYGMACKMFYETRGHKTQTFSHVALINNKARRTFFWGLLLAGIAFLLLVYYWLMPQYSLDNRFLMLSLVLVAAQILTGYFPVEKGNRLNPLHVLFGSIMAACMLTILILFASSDNVQDVVRIVNAVSALVMLGSTALAGLALKVSRNVIMHELLFFTAWHLAMLSVVYAA